MFQNNQLLKKLKKNFQKNKKTVQGIVKKTNYGFGFLKKKKIYKKLFIPSIYMNRVINGDLILAELKIEKGREIAIPIKLIKSFLKKFIGTIKKIGNKKYVIPVYPYIQEMIICNFDSEIFNRVNTGDWIESELVGHKLSGSNFFYAKILKFISKKTNNNIPWIVTLYRYQIECQEPKINISKYITDQEEKDRKDLTNLNFITIDNSNTKDIDDAIFIKKNILKEFIIYIAISDPTAYIKQNSELDILAYKKSFTNYLPGLDIPMIPRELSEKIYSIHPNKNKSTLVCKVKIDKNGFLIKKSINFFLATIQSKYKLSYEKVSNWIENNNSNWNPKNIETERQLNLLFEFFKKRFLWRKYHSLIFRDRYEYKFIFDKENNIIGINKEIRRIAHRMVEEAMIVANIASAIFLSKNIKKGIYNVHSGFNSYSFQKISHFLENYGVKLSIKNIGSIDNFSEARRFLNIYSDSYIHFRMKKLQSFGTISLIPEPHFALGVQLYSTWTSPIRKYTDMINHRLIKLIIKKKSHLCHDVLKKITISHILEVKNKNRLIEKELKKWLYFIFIKNNNFLNKIFLGEITDIYKNGIQVQLKKIGCYVLVPFYLIHYNKEEIYFNQILGIVLINGKVKYRVSDIVKIFIRDVNENTKIVVAEILN